MVRSARSLLRCQRQAARMETSRVRRLPDESCNSWPSSDSELGPTTKAGSKEPAFFGISASTLEDEASKSTQRENFRRTCWEATPSSAFHEKAGMSQVCFSLSVFSFLPVDSLHSSRTASVAILPSALFVERFSLGAWWAFPIQYVLQPDYRPRLPSVRQEFGQALGAVT